MGAHCSKQKLEQITEEPKISHKECFNDINNDENAVEIVRNVEEAIRTTKKLSNTVPVTRKNTYEKDYISGVLNPPNCITNKYVFVPGSTDITSFSVKKRPQSVNIVSSLSQIQRAQRKSIIIEPMLMVFIIK